MKSQSALVRSAQLVLRLQRLTREVEELVPDLEAVVTDTYDTASLGTAARSLQRAADAARAVVGGARVPDEVRALLEGTSPLISFFGSRLVLAGKAQNRPSTPSVVARALAVLLEDPRRSLDATEIATRLGCSVPIARTALHRLVRSGHATRPAAGRFRAKSR